MWKQRAHGSKYPHAWQVPRPSYMEGRDSGLWTCEVCQSHVHDLRIAGREPGISIGLCRGSSQRHRVGRYAPQKRLHNRQSCGCSSCQRRWGRRKRGRCQPHPAQRCRGDISLHWVTPGPGLRQPGTAGVTDGTGYAMFVLRRVWVRTTTLRPLKQNHTYCPV
eukprot:350958-Chlamydomonas_euryale.AAC.2